MAINPGLCKILRRLSISKKCIHGLSALGYHTLPSTGKVERNDFVPLEPRLQLASNIVPETRIAFSPASIRVDLNFPTSGYGRKNIVELPFVNNLRIDDPRKILQIENNVVPDKSIELPASENAVEKQAVRMLIIRRKKMKKHKLRKRRKKLKFVYRKKKQKREMRKEKAFQAELLAQIASAEKFDAKEYVASRLKELDRVPLPTRWMGHKASETIIKQLMEEKRQRKEKWMNRPRLRTR